MLEKIRSYFFNRSLQKILREAGSRNPKDFASSATFGILFDATDEPARQAVLDYAKELSGQGKKVELMGFFNDKNKQIAADFPFFTLRDLDWFQRPAQTGALSFAAQAFDVLVCAFPPDARPLEYLASLSKAHLRVGRYQENRTYCFDLMIDYDGAEGPAGLLRQMDRYLKIVNRKTK